MSHPERVHTIETGSDAVRTSTDISSLIVTVQRISRGTMLAALLTTISMAGGDNVTATSLSKNEPQARRAADALNPPETKEDMPPNAKFPETGEIFKEFQADQREMVKTIITHFQKNQFNPKFAGLHLNTFEELAKQDNLPALLEVVNAYRQGWYNAKANDHIALIKIMQGFENNRMTAQQERALQNQWREVTTRLQADRDLRKTLPTPSITPTQPPPPIGPTDENFRNLEKRPPQKQSNNESWRKMSAKARIKA